MAPQPVDDDDGDDGDYGYGGDDGDDGDDGANFGVEDAGVFSCGGEQKKI